MNMMERVELKYNYEDDKVYFVGSKQTAFSIQDSLELINCDDIKCMDCPFDSLHGCALVHLDNLLDKIE